MPVVVVRIEIRAPVEIVFDLCRSVDVHVDSTVGTNEKAVGGVTTGLMELGDEVTWRATHFGVRQTLTSRITKFDRPHMFRDSMVAGAFRRFDHDHLFTLVGDVTVVEDRFDFDTRLGILGWLASRLFLMRHMSAFLRVRLESIKTIAESGEAGRYLDAPSPGATGAICPFCKCPSAERLSSRYAYPIWDCACGAIGSGSGMFPDLDEVADGLLALLGLGGVVSEPIVPTGDTGTMAMQHYDIPKSLDQLADVLRGHGFVMKTSTWNESGHDVHCIWVLRGG